MGTHTPLQAKSSPTQMKNGKAMTEGGECCSSCAVWVSCVFSLPVQNICTLHTADEDISLFGIQLDSRSVSSHTSLPSFEETREGTLDS